jgi:hypothetical protein
MEAYGERIMGSIHDAVITFFKYLSCIMALWSTQSLTDIVPGIFLEVKGG